LICLIAALANTNSAVIAIFSFRVLLATSFAMRDSLSDDSAAVIDCFPLVAHISMSWNAWIPLLHVQWRTRGKATTGKKSADDKPVAANPDAAELEVVVEK
jgi:hypothetical protein